MEVNYSQILVCIFAFNIFRTCIFKMFCYTFRSLSINYSLPLINVIQLYLNLLYFLVLTVITINFNMKNFSYNNDYYFYSSLCSALLEFNDSHMIFTDYGILQPYTGLVISFKGLVNNNWVTLFCYRRYYNVINSHYESIVQDLLTDYDNLATQYHGTIFRKVAISGQVCQLNSEASILFNDSVLVSHSKPLPPVRVLRNILIPFTMDLTRWGVMIKINDTYFLKRFY